MKNTTYRQGYMPQLDTLRAIAVMLVIISHWLPSSHFLNRYLPNGILGVTLFFVLSGYLITGILLKSKEMMSKELPVKKIMGIFYIRRSLRIFPVYYLFLLTLVIFHPASIKPSLYWHVLYASNFYFWLHNSFSPQLSHLWSLAVEEQFYLIWPAIILFTRRLQLPAVFIVCIVAALIFRAFMYAPPLHLGRLLMPGSLDSFAIGALLAYGQFYKPAWYIKLAAVKHNCFLLMSVLMITVQLLLYFYSDDMLVLIFYYFLISIFFFTLILLVSEYKSNSRVYHLLFENPVLIYLGKISYGLYLFHLIIPQLNQLQLPFISNVYRSDVILLLRFLLLISMSGISWHFFEKPFLKLKDRFEIKLTKNSNTRVESAG